MTRKVSPCSAHTPPPLLCPGLEPVRVAHKNPWFSVLARGDYYTLEYERPQVVILPVLNGDSIVMIRVKRPLIGDCPLELPAGGALPGETPGTAAMREFAEETGIRVQDPSRFTPELPVSEMPGRMPVLVSVFRIDLNSHEFESRLPHDCEVFSVEAVPLSDIARKLVEGEIYLSSVAAIISRFLLKTLNYNPSASDVKTDRAGLF